MKTIAPKTFKAELTAIAKFAKERDGAVISPQTLERLQTLRRQIADALAEQRKSRRIISIESKEAGDFDRATTARERLFEDLLTALKRHAVGLASTNKASSQLAVCVRWLHGLSPYTLSSVEVDQLLRIVG